MNLTIEDLRSEWNERDRKLDESIRINTWLLRESYWEKHRSKIGIAGLGGWLEVLFSIPALIFFGWFISRHFDQPKFLLPALMLQVWTVTMLVLGIRQRGALRSMDYGRPVMELQRQIEVIKITRLGVFKWAFLTGQILWWTPFVIVLFKGLLDIDLYAASEFMPIVLAWNIAFGLAFIPIAIWASRRLVGRLGASPRFARFTDTIAGYDLAVARKFLEKLARFERETGLS